MFVNIDKTDHRDVGFSKSSREFDCAELDEGVGVVVGGAGLGAHRVVLKSYFKYKLTALGQFIP